MDSEPALLDTDTLSELGRGNPRVRERALSYLTNFGRLSIASITVFERLRGYRAAIRDGKPFDRQMRAFEALVVNSIVVPFDQDAADVAADIWAAATRKQRQQVGAILIAAVALSRKLPLVTRNRRDFGRVTNPSWLHIPFLPQSWLPPPRLSLC